MKSSTSDLNERRKPKAGKYFAAGNFKRNNKMGRKTYLRVGGKAHERNHGSRYIRGVGLMREGGAHDKNFEHQPDQGGSGDLRGMASDGIRIVGRTQCRGA